MGPYQCNRWPFVSGFFYLLNCFSSHIPVAISISILVFCWWIILHCMDISHLLVHSSVDGYLGIPPSFQLLRIIRLWTLMCKFSCEIIFNSPRRGMTGQKRQHTSLSEELPSCCPKGTFHFAFSPARYVHFNFSMSSPTLAIFCGFGYSHS